MYATNYTLLKSSFKLRYSPYTGITIVTVHKGLNQPLLGCCLRHELLLVSTVVQWAGRLHKEATNVPPSKQVATKLMWQQLNGPIKYVHVHETFTVACMWWWYMHDADNTHLPTKHHTAHPTNLAGKGHLEASSYQCHWYPWQKVLIFHPSAAER